MNKQYVGISGIPLIFLQNSNRITKQKQEVFDNQRLPVFFITFLASFWRDTHQRFTVSIKTIKQIERFHPRNNYICIHQMDRAQHDVQHPHNLFPETLK